MDKIKILYMDCHGNHGLIPPSRSDTTMTVGELIEYLKKEDPNMPIYISDDGWTYKCIDDSIFSNAFVNVIDVEKEIIKDRYERDHKNLEVL